MIASRAKRKRSPCQQGDSSQSVEIVLHSAPSLPEDIWYHILSLMPMRDAARAACVSRAFLESWRGYPNLTFSNEALGLNRSACGKDEPDRLFYSTVDGILKKHSGIGVKTLVISATPDYSAKDSCYLNGWLQTAVKRGIKELKINIGLQWRKKAKYNFPCSLLSNGSGDSIQYLHLFNCSLRPTVMLSLRSLTRLYLCFVHITGDELGCLLSRSFALEQLQIKYCSKIVCLKIPCLLQRLRYLEVYGNVRLKVIYNEAPYLSKFRFEGRRIVQLSLGEASQMKNLYMCCAHIIFLSRSKLASMMPNIEALTIDSYCERANTRMLQSKFLYLKHLVIRLPQTGNPSTPMYDYLSLACFFGAAPSLETLTLHVRQVRGDISSFADLEDLRQMQEEHHHNLKSVRITGFCSVKSLIELACHVLENTPSLDCLMLETHQSCVPCFHPENTSGKCTPLERYIVAEGHRAALVVKRYIEPNVPSTVKLHVLEPCSCHADKL